MTDIVAMYVTEQKSIPQIAAALGIPRSRARTLLLRAGVTLRARADGVRLRADAIGDASRGKKRLFTPAWKQNIAKGRLAWGDKNAAGTCLKPSGYVEYTRGEHKGRSVHVVNMEARLGRPLRDDEIVHHIDGDRSNNADNNLALMTRSGHSRLHRREEGLANIKSERKENGRFR